MCCHDQRAGPDSTYAERGASSIAWVSRSPPFGVRWKRIRDGASSDTPAIFDPNIGALAKPLELRRQRVRRHEGAIGVVVVESEHADRAARSLAAHRHRAVVEPLELRQQR